MIDVPIISKDRLIQSITEWARRAAREHNNLASGYVSATRSDTAAPTTGFWNAGDFVRNSAPAETGTNIPKYALLGWLCVTAGEPGTWVEVRTKTGSGTDFSKLLTASATLDFASIAAGAIGTATITVTGAATGDFVTVSAPSGLEAGLMFCGLVTAADTVTIRLHNTTGGAIDPASATWKATVSAYA